MPKGPKYRQIWEAANGPVPKGWDVHHINGNHNDDRLENLIAKPERQHIMDHELDRYAKRITNSEDPNEKIERGKRAREIRKGLKQFSHLIKHYSKQPKPRPVGRPKGRKSQSHKGP